MATKLRAAAVITLTFILAACSTPDAPILDGTYEGWCYTLGLTGPELEVRDGTVSGTPATLRSVNGSLDATYTHTTIVEPSAMQANIRVELPIAISEASIVADIDVFGIRRQISTTVTNNTSGFQEFVIAGVPESAGVGGSQATVSVASLSGVTIIVSDVIVAGANEWENPFPINNCGGEQPTPTPTREEIEIPTSAPTNTVMPTNTPLPTFTLTPSQTPTPQPNELFWDFEGGSGNWRTVVDQIGGALWSLYDSGNGWVPGGGASGRAVGISRALSQPYDIESVEICIDAPMSGNNNMFRFSWLLNPPTGSQTDSIGRVYSTARDGIVEEANNTTSCETLNVNLTLQYIQVQAFEWLSPDGDPDTDAV
ncbi:MAG: hypothetical protein AAF125_22875, partial [Chloroflexota bacterium]